MTTIYNDNAGDAEKWRLLQAEVAIAAYEEKFGRKPKTVEELSAPITEGQLDNLPRDERGVIDVDAWELG